MSAYRARMARRALRRATYDAVANRQIGLLAATAALLVICPDAPLLDEALGGPAAVSAVAAPAADVAIPRIFATTAMGGPAHAYVQRTSATGSTVRFEASAFQTIEQAWSAAFFGDKQRMAEFIAHSAVINGLPVAFLTHLLRRESGLDHRAVSRAGAQGVAQFMPATASERGLIDPFDPFEAIPKSAELLKEYRTRFGSLGLAAAAYNAGPQRVKDWLAGRSALPKETRAYVSTITGRSADDWRQNGESYALAEPWLGPARD
ncbi:lytic transglycosylase domain-containing protein [Methylobacterium nigriterrae]|uniref:lytic transglycosylase domain-containing protein n=1 Tax=Methylobacterium nigriterrae TaxID=3127512 RepID=UPI00301397AB